MSRHGRVQHEALQQDRVEEQEFLGFEAYLGCRSILKSLQATLIRTFDR